MEKRGRSALKDILIRDAVANDAPALADVCVMAGHGVMAMFYEGLVPGKSVDDCIIARRILDPESVSTLRRWRIAADASGNILGALNSLPHRALMEGPDDPLLDEARLQPIAGLLELEAAAPEGYYVNIIAVYPQYRGSGAGYALMREAERLARLQNSQRMSLCTLDSDPGLLGFYHRQGFEIRASRPMGTHPAMTASGNFVLMVRELQG
jgi:ribosomal protein S18 acetylase RimI-like enzyme